MIRPFDSVNYLKFLFFILDNNSILYSTEVYCTVQNIVEIYDIIQNIILII